MSLAFIICMVRGHNRQRLEEWQPVKHAVPGGWIWLAMCSRCRLAYWETKEVSS
ncbi:hypothetical protein LCGC14_1083330 [marine sediment metagenome]|uniref:Uncharacterized protein n=1 Tax=marine sediment metagenome TaxID=412755 RepID=A0A0F9MEQ2_9ZZZZ